MKSAKRFLLVAMIVAFVSGVVGCSGKQPTEQERAAITKVIRDTYKAQDRAIEIKVNSIRVEGDEAKVVITVLYPEFHSLGLKHDVVVKRQGASWKIVSDKKR